MKFNLKQMARKRTERRSRNATETTGFRIFFNNDTTDFILGMILLFFAIYTIIAMVSYLSSAQVDQSILEDTRAGEWMNNDKEFSNYCGSLGAILSYFFISVNFGFSAFLIPVFIIIIGLQLMRAYRVNLWKWFFCMMIIMIWSSITFSKMLTPFMGELAFNPGGNHGLICVIKIENLIGPPGLVATLILSAICFLTYLTTETINVIRKAMNPIKYVMGKVKITVTNHEVSENATIEDTGIIPESEDGKTEPETIIEQEKEMSSPVLDLTEDLTVNIQKPILSTSTEIQEPEKTDGNLTVNVASNEDKAKGNTLASGEPIFNSEINPKEPFLNYEYPTLDLLKKYDNDGKPEVDMEEIKSNNARIVEVLNSFGVAIREIKATVGPTITLYEITPAEGVRISKIRNLEDDIALSLSALGIRIIAPIPGKGTIGIEVPNANPKIVSMRSIINSKKFQETTYDLPVALGKTITNDVFMVDLTKAPHMLVAGATGQGKSVGLNAIVTSLLYKKHPAELKFVIIDPKKVEFSVYAPIERHFLAKLPDGDDAIITDVTKVVQTLNSLCSEMDTRYDLLRKAGCRNIKEYNAKFISRKLNPEKGHRFMPYIVIIIDEFGDLIMTAGKEIELPICRIAQLARAIGIHAIIATQRPTTNIITGTIKANFPARIAFRVAAMMDSRTILDRSGAQQLIGKGDMLYLQGNDPVRVQCAFVDTPEVENITNYISKQQGYTSAFMLPEYVGEESESTLGDIDMNRLDPMFEDAARLIVIHQQGSTSLIQRKFSIGYNRAGRIMDQLERAGIVGPTQGSKAREVLCVDETDLQMRLSNLQQ